MKRISLWTGSSAGMMVSALGLAAIAVGTVLLTQAAVGQAADDEDRPQLSRKDVSDLLVAAREAIREGRLDDAEEIVAQAEAAEIDYPLFYRGDTPKRVRKSLNEARVADDRPARPSLPNPLAALTGRRTEAATDPFANRDRNVPAGAYDGTAMPGPGSYPTEYPAHVSMPTPPPIDVPFAPPAAPQVANAPPSDRQAASANAPADNLSVQTLLQNQVQSPSRAASSFAQSGGIRPTSGDPAALAAAQTALRSARLALAVGDTRTARQHLVSAKSLGASHPPGRDRPAAVEAAIVRLEELMADRNKLGADPAWRRQYGTILCEQASALVEYRAFDEAERLVADATRLGVSYGPYDINPQQVMQKIALARRGGQAQATMWDSFASQNASAPASPVSGAKEQVLRLMAAARAALAAGDIRQAEGFLEEATALRVPAEQFAAGEDHPTLVMIDIQKAKMARAQRDSNAPNEALASQRPQLNLEVQQSLYTPETDRSVNVPVAGMQLDEGPPQPALGVPTLAQLPTDEVAPQPSEAARLLRDGESALRDGDTQSALQYFREAYAHRGDLDPLDVQRLQGHLQMLSVSGNAAPQPGEGGSLIDAANQTEQVLVRQLSSELTRLQTESRRLRSTNPERALTVLEEARATIESASLSPPVKAQLLRRVELSIRDTDEFIAQNRAQLELDATNRDILEEVERRRQARLAMQQRIAELVDQFNTLQDEQRYEEMEIVAQRLYELAPEEQVAQMAWSTAKAYRRDKLNQLLKYDKEQAVFDAFSATERSAIPFDDSIPFQHGSVDTWEQLTASRKELQARRSRLNERELEIQRKLRMPVQVDYVDTPLQEVMNDLGQMTGVTIHLDQYGLGQENISTDEPVTLPLRSEISLKSVLNLILEPLHLDYVIQDEVLKITSEQRAQGAVVQRVYDVADLVIPIPNFVPGSNMGLQGLINDAHMTAAGQWLTGPSPMAVVNNDRGKGGKTLANQVMAQQGITGASSLNTPTVPLTSGPGPLGGGAAADFESLISLITTTVHAESWDFAGGPGSIKEFPTNLSLVISQTQEVHEEIADLLEQLRRLQDLQVTIEVRFITLSDNFFEQIGVDFDFLIEDGPGTIPELQPNPVTGTPLPGQRIEGRHRSATVGLLPSTTLTDFPNFTADLDIPFTQDSFSMISPQFGTPVNVAQFGFAILSDLEAYFVVQAAQGDRRSNVLEAPKVTLFNGQTAFVQDTTSRPFVTSVIPVVGDFAAAQQPVIVVLSEGTMMSIQAVVSEDRRYVRLTVVPFFTQIGDVEEFTFEGSTTTTTGSSSVDDDDDGNSEEESSDSNVVRSGTTVQLPTFAQISVSTTVSVPDGGTVLLGGIKRLSEGRNEFGVPLLSKLPYVNRLFRNVGIGRQTQSLMMMVTPRIIIQEEEEQRLLGTLP